MGCESHWELLESCSYILLVACSEYIWTAFHVFEISFSNVFDPLSWAGEECLLWFLDQMIPFHTAYVSLELILVKLGSRPIRIENFDSC